MMQTMIVYQSEDSTIVMHIDDEAEFVARFFDEDGPDWEIWERTEINGPLEIERPARPDILGVYDNYEI
jgi:hypothetical protein